MKTLEQILCKITGDTALSEELIKAIRSYVREVAKGMELHVIPELIIDDINDVLSRREKARQTYNQALHDLCERI